MNEQRITGIWHHKLPDGSWEVRWRTKHGSFTTQELDNKKAKKKKPVLEKYTPPQAYKKLEELLARAERQEQSQNHKNWTNLWADNVKELQALFPAGASQFTTFAKSFGYRLGDLDLIIEHRKEQMEHIRKKEVKK